MNVPKLRFKEFKDEYVLKRLEDICSITMGQSPNSTYYTTNSKDIILIQGNADLDNGKIIPRIYTKQITKVCDKNDIIMTVRAPVGDIAVTDYFACIGRGVCSIKSSKYIYYYLENLKFKEYWKKISKGSTIDSITSNDIKSLIINYPCLQEQTKIANFLSLLDKKIELQTKKIEALKLYKKGLLIILFSKKVLSNICVKELGNIVTGTTPSKNEENYWENGDIVWVTPSDITDKRDIDNSYIKLTKKGLSKGRYIPKNSILVTCIASIGKNAVLKVDGSCNQQINAIIPNEKYNYNYVYYVINNLSKYMQSIAGISATSIINKEQFGNIIVGIHDIKWQNKIDKILSLFERKIMIEVLMLDELQNLKKGLIQKMFV